jgi:hypothetical protein
MNRKRMYNMIYRTRKKGVRIDTRQRTIFILFHENLSGMKQVRTLQSEYNFGLQLYMPML